MTQQQFDLDAPLLRIQETPDNIYSWNIRQAVEGVQIFGGIGSGKTSGSGRTLALEYLKAGFGGLVLTAKPDEKDMWVEYCKMTGRSNDLIIVEPGGKQFFNFLEYESTRAPGTISITENIVQVLKTVIQSSAEKSGGKQDDPFWDAALDMLLFNSIDLCQLAYGKVSVDLLYSIVTTSPKKGEDQKDQADEKTAGSFKHAFSCAVKTVTEKSKAYEAGLSWEKRKGLQDPVKWELALQEEIPEAKMLTDIDNFFVEVYRPLSEKTRSIIDFSFSSFLFRLTKDPVHTLFCRKVSTFKPEDSIDGKIIIINLPVKLYHKVGRDCQVMFKYMWQRAIEKRSVDVNDRPVFLWADEAQNFIHAYDAECQATARSSRIATVYLSQNLPNYHANMGGEKSEFRVKSFLGTLATQIFHSNTDVSTNHYASELIGSDYKTNKSKTTSMGSSFSTSDTESKKLEKVVRPEQFVRLKNGGPLNDHDVTAIMYVQGKGFYSGFNHREVTFSQL
jgi:hypothetical protein